VTLQPGLEISEGNRQRHYSLQHIWLPVNVQ